MIERLRVLRYVLSLIPYRALLDGLKSLGSVYHYTDARSALGGKSLTTVVAEWTRRKWPCSPKQQFDEWKTDL